MVLTQKRGKEINKKTSTFGFVIHLIVYFLPSTTFHVYMGEYIFFQGKKEKEYEMIPPNRLFLQGTILIFSYTFTRPKTTKRKGWVEITTLIRMIIDLRGHNVRKYLRVLSDVTRTRRFTGV